MDFDLIVLGATPMNNDRRDAGPGANPACQGWESGATSACAEPAAPPP